MSKKRFTLFNWIWNSTFVTRIKNNVKEFFYIWALLFLLFFVAIFIAPSNWTCAICLFGIILALLTALILIRPMNAVYGLMGTSGSVPFFFFNFIFITFLFAGVYYWAFFKDAGIAYEKNHIDFQMFQDTDQEDSIKVSCKRDTLYFEHQLDTILFKESVVNIRKDSLYYQKIHFGQVWRSSIITTLTQGPTDLLSAATVHNSGTDSSNVTLDKEKSTYLEWILIFHILISWIFFGVFISLLYNKFRYES